MTACKHTSLTLLPGAKSRRRCRHCHLTIEKHELGESYCPECFETSGKKRYEFEDVRATGSEPTRYRCEGCGVIVECE